MGKSSAHSKHKDKQRKDAQGDPIMLSKQRWSDWSNFVLGAAAMTSTILYVWRKMQANQINRAGQAPRPDEGAQAEPDTPSTGAARSMTDHLSESWGKAEQPSDAPLSGRDAPIH
jgi:hypothetical protein